MKWLSVKKYKPCSSNSYKILARVLEPETNYCNIVLADYLNNLWFEEVNCEPIESDGRVVTHFMYIPPLEIEE